MVYRLLWLLLLAGWSYWLIALHLTREFFRTRGRKKQEDKEGEYLPPVSVLKPARGFDYKAYENLKSFCRQDYPCFEILIGVDDPEDPYVALVERLKKDFPYLSIKLVITSPVGANRKVGILDRLAREARYEILAVSDSDTRVGPDYLRRLIAPLADPRVGLVTCPYREEEAISLPAVFQALYIGTTFLPSVMVARYVLSMRFALGASFALRTRDLEKIGGFASLADYLADDYQIGARVAAAGGRVYLTDYVVSCIAGPTTFRDLWRREVRWARCSWLSQPWGYLGLPVTFSLPLAFLFCLGYGWNFPGWAVLAVSLLLRLWVAHAAAGCLGDQTSRENLFWLPLRDVLTALVWVAGLLGRRVVWRGESFILHRDGRMEPERVAPRSPVIGV